MMKTIEQLWNEYLVDKCSAISTEEERMVAEKAARLHEKVSSMLSREQNEALDKCIASIYESEAFIARKAFLKGCEFAVSFILEANK
ncbi:MAG: hypothetical protein IJX02_06015 [Clostridia bacterium]|nr:hypothetical protein [Clostridia bacterium]